MHVKTLASLIAVNLAICYAAAGGGSRLAEAKSSLAALEERNTWAHLEAVALVASEELAELQMLPWQVKLGGTNNDAIVERFKEASSALSSGSLHEAYRNVASQLGVVGRETLREAAARISNAHPRFLSIKDSADLYFEYLKKWSMEYGDIATGLRWHLLHQEARGEESLKAHRSIIIARCDEEVQIIQRGISMMDSVVNMLARIATGGYVPAALKASIAHRSEKELSEAETSQLSALRLIVDAVPGMIEELSAKAAEFGTHSNADSKISAEFSELCIAIYKKTTEAYSHVHRKVGAEEVKWHNEAPPRVSNASEGFDGVVASALLYRESLQRWRECFERVIELVDHDIAGEIRQGIERDRLNGAREYFNLKCMLSIVLIDRSKAEVDAACQVLAAKTNGKAGAAVEGPSVEGLSGVRHVTGKKDRKGIHHNLQSESSLLLSEGIMAMGDSSTTMDGAAQDGDGKPQTRKDSRRRGGMYAEKDPLGLDSVLSSQAASNRMVNCLVSRAESGRASAGRSIPSSTDSLPNPQASDTMPFLFNAIPTPPEEDATVIHLIARRPERKRASPSQVALKELRKVASGQDQNALVLTSAKIESLFSIVPSSVDRKRQEDSSVDLEPPSVDPRGQYDDQTERSASILSRQPIDADAVLSNLGILDDVNHFLNRK